MRCGTTSDASLLVLLCNSARSRSPPAGLAHSKMALLGLMLMLLLWKTHCLQYVAVQPAALVMAVRALAGFC